MTAPFLTRPAETDSSRKERTVLLLLLVLFCASGLFDHSLWTPNDSREGGMIAEMYRTGHWAALTLNGEPFLEKPPLLHWTALILCTATGSTSPGLLRLPAALFGFGTALVLWSWGRRLGSERAGAAAAFLFATNITAYEYSRIILTDICVTFAVVVSLEAFRRAYEAAEFKAGRYAVFVLAASLSFYAKGLIGPVFIMASVVAFLALKREWKLASTLSVCVAFGLTAAVTPWVVALYRAGGREYLISAFVDNQLGRFFRLPTGGAITALPIVGPMLSFMADRPLPFDPYFVHKEPIYHYLVKLPIRLLPWTLLMPPALIHWFGKSRRASAPFASLLSCALVTMLVILHAASAKAGNYALPLFPIVFLMVGVWCDEAAGTALSVWAAVMISVTAVVVAAFAVLVPGLYLALLTLPKSAYTRVPESLALGDPSQLVWAQGAGLAVLGAARSVAALAFAFWLFRMSRARISERDYASGVLGLAVTVALVGMLAGSALMPAYDRQRTFEPIARLAVAELARGSRVALATDDSKFVGEFVYYTGRRLPLIHPVPGVRAFFDGEPGEAGVLVPVAQLQAVEVSLRGIDHEIQRVPDDAGINAKEFCLITRR